jgi:sugar/nucleoside kinase (ribokinase family)
VQHADVRAERPAPVLVNGPASWNTVVVLDQLPAPRPHMAFARRHWQGLGGTSAGKSLALARLGVPVALRTVLGTDDDAAAIRGALAHPLLDVRAQVVTGPSEHHLNLMSAHGERVSLYLDAAPDPGPAPTGVLDVLRGAPVAVLDLAAHSLELLPAARAAGAEIWCDVHDDDGVAAFQEPFRTAADVLVVSEDRLADPHAYLAARVADGARWAVCTRGSRGAVALGAEEGWVEVDAVPVPEVVDTNGAGDAFVAGMLAARLDGLPLAECLRWGAVAGAQCVQTHHLVPDLVRADVAARAHAAEVRGGGRG